jgi:ribosomal protein L37AE/L43A
MKVGNGSVLARKATWAKIAVLILLTVLGYTVLTYWTIVSTYLTTIAAFINTYVIALASTILAIYALASKWWSHKRGLLDSKQKSIHNLHVSLEEFNQTCLHTALNESNGLQRLSSSANSALTRFSEAFAQSRHVAPGYLILLSEDILAQLFTLATSNYHNIKKLKEARKEFTNTFKDLLSLSTTYEGRFRIRYEYGLFRRIFRIKNVDPNLTRCPTCQSDNSPLDKYCHKCRTDLAPVQKQFQYWVCPKCSHLTHDPHLYCARCGEPMQTDDKHTVVVTIPHTEESKT